MSNEWAEKKDEVGLDELETIIHRLLYIKDEGIKAKGRCRPIINATEIELIKDHLDLVVKYTKL